MIKVEVRRAGCVFLFARPRSKSCSRDNNDNTNNMIRKINTIITKQTNTQCSIAKQYEALVEVEVRRAGAGAVVQAGHGDLSHV